MLYKILLRKIKQSAKFMENQKVINRKKHHSSSKFLTKLFLLFCLAFITLACVQCASPQSTAQEAAPPAPAAVSAAPVQTPQPQVFAPLPSISVSPAPAPAPIVVTPPPSPVPPQLPILPEYEKLYKQNPDLIGWLSIEGTIIDYPVMYTPDDHDYYLSHNFKKKKDKNGLLVLQASCDPYTPGANLIIHGHKMKSGKMFGTLAKYQKKSYWQQHKTIRFDTLYARGEYEVLAAFRSKIYDEDEDVFRYYRFTDAATQAEFDDFLLNIKKLSLYDTGVTAQFGDALITLSTCSYHTRDGRFAVVARKIK